VARLSVLRGLLLAPVLALAGCQACVADSSEPQEQATSRPEPGAAPGRFRPRPMTPSGRMFLLHDAGADDE
jgi:hypothetical protein